MRIVSDRARLTIRSTPGCLWIFGLWFVAGGALAIAMPWIATNRDEISGWARLASVAIGAACAAAGLGIVLHAPALETTVDHPAGRVTHRRRGLLQRREETFPVRDLAGVVVEEGRDGDGDPVFNLLLTRRGGPPLPLLSSEARGREWTAARAGEIATRLGLPAPVHRPKVERLPPA